MIADINLSGTDILIILGIVALLVIIFGGFRGRF